MLGLPPFLTCASSVASLSPTFQCSAVPVRPASWALGFRPGVRAPAPGGHSWGGPCAFLLGWGLPSGVSHQHHGGHSVLCPVLPPILVEAHGPPASCGPAPAHTCGRWQALVVVLLLLTCARGPPAPWRTRWNLLTSREALAPPHLLRAWRGSARTGFDPGWPQGVGAVVGVWTGRPTCPVPRPLEPAPSRTVSDATCSASSLHFPSPLPWVWSHFWRSPVTSQVCNLTRCACHLLELPCLLSQLLCPLAEPCFGETLTSPFCLAKNVPSVKVNGLVGGLGR